MTTKQFFDEKYEGEKYFLGIDFSRKISSGETVESAVITVSLAGVDVTSTVIDSTQTSITSPYVYFWLKDTGTADDDFYKIVVAATTDQTSVYKSIAYLKIVSE